MFESRHVTEVVCRPMLPPADCVRFRLSPCRQDPVSGRLGFRLPGSGPGLKRWRESNPPRKRQTLSQDRTLTARRSAPQSHTGDRRSPSVRTGGPPPPGSPAGAVTTISAAGRPERPALPLLALRRAVASLSVSSFASFFWFYVPSPLNCEAGGLPCSGEQLSCPGGHSSSIQERPGSPPCGRASTSRLSNLAMSLFEAKHRPPPL